MICGVHLEQGPCLFFVPARIASVQLAIGMRLRVVTMNTLQRDHPKVFHSAVGVSVLLVTSRDQGNNNNESNCCAFFHVRPLLQLTYVTTLLIPSWRQPTHRSKHAQRQKTASSAVPTEQRGSNCRCRTFGAW